MYIPSASPNTRGPNTTYIPIAHIELALGFIGPRRGPNTTYIPSACVELALDIIGSHWALSTPVGHYWLALGGHVGSARLFRYQHVGISKAKRKVEKYHEQNNKFRLQRVLFHH